jgi:PAS domain S-box-containing protein
MLPKNGLGKLAEYSNDIVCTIDEEGKFVWMNRAVEKILGYKPSEVIGRHFIDFIYSEDSEKNKNITKELLNGEKVQNFVTRYLHKDGSIISIEWSANWDSSESLLYCIARDKTDLFKTKENYRKLFHQSPLPQYVYDLKTLQFVDMNHAALKLYKYSKKELNNLTLLDLRPEEEQERLKKAIQKYSGSTGNEVIKFGVFTHLDKEGKRLKIDITGQKIELNGKECVMIIGVDLTDEYRTMNERNRILESISDAFFAVDREWTVTYWNREAEAVLGTKSSDIVGKNLWEVYEDAVDLDFYHQYHKAMKTGRMVGFEEYYPTLNKWFDVTAYPSENGLSVYFRDVSIKKTAEESLRTLNDELQKQAKELSISNAELEQFAYVASHDLQEPLRMITSFLTQLEKNYKGVLDDKAKKYIEYAVDGAKRMRQIILDLLDFSRVGKNLDHMEEIDLNVLIDEISMMYRRRIDAKSAQIIRKQLPVIYSHRTALFQIFQNLISNSIKYAREGEPPKIHISAEEHKEVYQFTIRDNGIGIEKEYFDKVFILFQRLHGRDEYSGSGMGLAIVKKWVENLGGQIWLRSREGEGSTFTFTIAKRKE